MEEVKKQGTESLFVPYKIALKLKELGFDEHCFAFYRNDRQDKKLEYTNIELAKNYNGINSKGLFIAKNEDLFLFVSCPTFSQAFRWFRSKYSICVEIHQTTDWEEDNESWSFVIFKYRLGNNDGMVNSIIDYDTYEEAELACLDKLIDIVKNKKL